MAATEELQGEELESLLDQLQRQIDRLRVLYEQFFQGNEKTPPAQLQKEVVRAIYRLQKAKIQGASGKFRFQSLMQRFNAHKSYWARSLREIEEGRHHRQIHRAEHRKEETKRGADEDVLTMEDYLAINMVRDQQGEEAAKAAEAERRRRREAELADAASDYLAEIAGGSSAADDVIAMPSTVPKHDREIDGDAPAASVSGAQSKTGRRPPPNIRGMSSDEIAEKADKLKEMRDRMASGNKAIRARNQAGAGSGASAPRDVDREVFDKFVAARRSLNQSTDRLSFESVKSSLEKQRAKVRRKHDCARVDFDVVVKDGSAFLKPIPVKDA